MKRLFLAAAALCASAAFAWGPGHDTTVRCLLKRLPRELASRMTPEWNERYEEASHLPDHGRPELLKDVDRKPLEALGWDGGMQLHENPLRFEMFNRLVDAVKRDDAYSQFMLIAALSHVNADPAACNHNPVVQCGSYIWGCQGLNLFPELGLDFASVEETPVMRAVMEKRLAAVPEPTLPAKIGFEDVYGKLIRLQWEATELCNGRGSDVMAYAVALHAGDTSAEPKLAEALCDLGMYAVEHTLWLYAAAVRLAEEGAEPPADFDAETFTAAIDAEMKRPFLERPFGADGHIRPYLPVPGVRNRIRVLYDAIAFHAHGVMAPPSRILAPQAVSSLRHLFPSANASLLDIREAAEKGVDPAETEILVVFGGRFVPYLGFDVKKLLANIVAYARKGGKVLWVNGVPPKGLADAVTAAQREPHPLPDGYCNETYPVPLRELVGATVAWTGDDPVSFDYKRRPTGMAGWFWQGSRHAFDPAKLPPEAKGVMELRARDRTFLMGVVYPKERPVFAYMPTLAFFPYVLTREKPSLADFALRFDSAGEAFLARTVEALLGEAR